MIFFKSDTWVCDMKYMHMPFTLNSILSVKVVYYIIQCFMVIPKFIAPNFCGLSKVAVVIHS